MRGCSRAALFFCAIAWSAAALAGQANGQPPRIVAGLATSPVHLDGVLDETPWQQAGVIENLMQQSPHPGAPTHFRTEVRFLVDGDTLFIGVTCLDPNPSLIAVHTMQRDGDMSGDDTIAVFTGRMTDWEQTISYTTPGGHLQLGLLMGNIFGYLPQGDFIERLFQLKVVYAFTPDLILSCYAQYDNDSDDLGVNARLRWTIQPGTDLYVVWNHNWDHPVGAENWWTLTPVSDQAVVKLRDTWRS